MLPLDFAKNKPKDKRKTAQRALELVGIKEQTSTVTSCRADKNSVRLLPVLSVFENMNESSKTIIIVIHDKDIAAKCRRVIEIADGRIVSDSKSK